MDRLAGSFARQALNESGYADYEMLAKPLQLLNPLGKGESAAPAVTDSHLTPQKEGR